MMESSHQEEQLLSPAASAAEASAEHSSIQDNAPPPAAEVSPGEGAFSPPNDDIQQDHDDRGGGEGDHAAAAVGFGPPPAFPTSSRSLPLGKRKRTLLTVSTSAAGSGAPLEDDSSEEEDEGGSRSQMIHRIKTTSVDTKSPTDEDEDGAAKKYNDAMLLASLSDVDSPKKQEELEQAASTDNNDTEATSTYPPSQEQVRQESTQSPKATINSSNAPTPLRSNVNPNPLPVESVVKPFALMPKPAHGGYAPNKRPKSSPTAMTAAPRSPDGRDPKAVRPKSNEKTVREGIAPVYAPHPSHQAQVQPGSGYPPTGAYHPGYPYSYGGQPPHPAASAAVGHPHPGAYPPGYNPYMGYPYASQGPPGSAPMMGASPYGHPRAYYHPQDPRAPQAHTPSSSSGAPGPDRMWGHYHSPKHGARKTSSSGAGPEPVRSSTDTSRQSQQHTYHPLSGSPSNRQSSHVVPSEDGSEGAEGVYGRPPPGYHGGPPPGLGYPTDSRYGPPVPPGSTRDPRDPYYAAQGPVPHEYNAISHDEGTPPRTSPPRSSSRDYPPGMNTPPRGYDYYGQDQQGAPGGPPPGSHHGAYPPQGGYHPDSPPRSSASGYPHGHPYGGPPPPSAHDPYEPFDYSPTTSPHGGAEAHYQVPTAVSNETEPLHPQHVHPGVPPPSSSSGAAMQPTHPTYHQFRKGGRSIHSEPIILRKKFSWRNYPELEEYLIANRTDYLRHSALNYTAEQKHFNNRLTEGLLELAAKLNYVFDETCFNFVAVRDRIRCYYKSYVQSSKKRGVVVGFNSNVGGGVKNEADGTVGLALGEA